MWWAGVLTNSFRFVTLSQTPGFPRLVTLWFVSVVGLLRSKLLVKQEAEEVCFHYKTTEVAIKWRKRAQNS